MVSSPSNIINIESSSQITLLGEIDEVVTEPSSSLSLTIGGREIQPPSKYQRHGMKDNTRKRKVWPGKCGHRSHGSYH
ncbi:hypothetical protein Bca101_066630 [Brassica carinata]